MGVIVLVKLDMVLDEWEMWWQEELSLWIFEQVCG